MGARKSEPGQDEAGRRRARGPRVAANEARDLGTSKAIAVIDLSRALPGKHTPAALLAHASALAHALATHHVEAKVTAVAAGKATGARVRLELPTRNLAALVTCIGEVRA